MMPTGNAPFAVRVEDIRWDRVHPDGTRSTTLCGSRQAGRSFAYGFSVPAGVWDGSHSHSADAWIVVARGELRLGYGPRLVRSAAIAYPVGSFLYVPAGVVHFDGAEVDTVIIGTAIGPWSTTYLSEPPDRVRRECLGAARQLAAAEQAIGER
jgi:quercetin dioxygenase-like cupin family protein